MGLNNRKENRKMEQTIQLSDHFGYRRLIRFTIPSILMMIFTSIYGVVDGFFVSNFVGKTSFAAVNFIMPFLMITGVMGFMFGTGGSINMEILSVFLLRWDAAWDADSVHLP